MYDSMMMDVIKKFKNDLKYNIKKLFFLCLTFQLKHRKIKKQKKLKCKETY